MRIALLIALAVCTFSADQAAAQSAFHTDWGRHLGWGSGPGYHAYTQQEIHAWGTRCLQHGAGCTTCAPVLAQDATMLGGLQGAWISPGSQPVIPGPRIQQPRAALAPVPAAPTGPRLAPPRQIWAPVNTPAAPPSAYRVPGLGPHQFHGPPTQSVQAIPPHVTNPLITPTGAASRLWATAQNPRPVRPATIIRQPMPSWVQAANATAVYPRSLRRQ